MFDVKTGLLMFTTRRSVSAQQHTNAWRQDAKLAKLASAATSQYAPELAVDTLVDLRRFAAAAVAENVRRGGSSAVVQVPSIDGGPTVATDVP